MYNKSVYQQNWQAKEVCLRPEQFPQCQRLYTFLRRPWVGYIACILLTILNVLLVLAEQHMAINIILPGGQLVIQIALVAYLWGFLPALLMLCLGLIVIDAFFISDLSSLFAAHSLDVTLQFITFAGFALLIAALFAQREKALRLAAQREKTICEAHQQLENYLSVISHELKTPLTGTQGHIQLAKRKLKNLPALLDEEHPDRQIIQRVYRSLEQAQKQTMIQHRLINDLLDASRIHTNRVSYTMKICNLTEIVQDTVQSARLTNPQRCIKLEVDIQEKAIIRADADRIGQVLNNYLSNALKYAPLEKPIHVSLYREGESACVAVQDEGPGLNEEEQKNIWERFYRAKDIMPVAQDGVSHVNLGLGLYICKAIIRDHQGQLGVTSQPGAGSTFWFSLPLDLNKG
ncbi:sensor histidine kinase [Dictyobacter arantiisoli]|uniref:histidine kinase n=1 Tax=Dictyobacter arantiisoli TaxID=2014874 RepID=A0A5A5TAA4_9CHLR|nr:HAMP domain-containing sensor histidine kinase [Dictyobacter arantiisoli]GCF08440.1 hypothetical protein KDI_20040 [Dictyobacter arantiisoli]